MLIRVPRAGGYVAAELPTPPETSNLKVYLDASLGVTKDGSNLVSQWDDQSANAYAFTPTTDSEKPTWVSNVVGGRPAIQFKDTNDCLRVASFSQGYPFKLYLMLRQDTWAASARIISCNTGGSGPEMFQGGSSPTIYMAPTSYITNSNASMSAFHLHECIWNGASSSYTVDDGTPQTGTLDSSTCVSFFIGKYYGTGYYGNFSLAEMVGYTAVHDSTQRANMLDYFTNKYGIP